MKKIKISVVIGTRPELIRISPLVRLLHKDAGVAMRFIDTGQHYDYELDGIFIKELELPKPVSLGVGSHSQGEQTGLAMIKIEKELVESRPDAVVVVGDTNSTLAGALSAAKLGIPVVHIEAGLRSYDRQMPEEINRVIVDHISSLLFAPTKNAVKNLAAEGITGSLVSMIGDITVDAVFENHKAAEKKSGILKDLKLQPSGYVLATVHRAENVDKKENLCAIMDALLEISKGTKVIFPLHPRTLKNLKAFGVFGKYDGKISFIKPVGFFDFIKLLGSAACIITDSGGVQKEALILKTPCVTVRTTTEWVETTDLNANVLVGTNKKAIVREVINRSDAKFHKFVQGLPNPYGDGKAGERMINEIKKRWG